MLCLSKICDWSSHNHWTCLSREVQHSTREACWRRVDLHGPRTSVHKASLQTIINNNYTFNRSSYLLCVLMSSKNALPLTSCIGANTSSTCVFSSSAIKSHSFDSDIPKLIVSWRWRSKGIAITRFGHLVWVRACLVIFPCLDLCLHIGQFLWSISTKPVFKEHEVMMCFIGFGYGLQYPFEKDIT